MRSLAAIRALWFGITDPGRVPAEIKDAAVAVFATAVLLLSLTMTAATLVESTDVVLQKESSVLARGAQNLLGSEQVDLSSSQRRFTAVLGGALMNAIISTVVLGVMFWILLRFMTDQPISYLTALAGVSAMSGIDVVKSIAMTPLHLLTHSNRIGLHAGIFTDPSSHPFLFAWLQRFDVFSLWQYLAIGAVLAISAHLHHRYGLVVGGVVFLIVQLLFGGLTLVAWVVAQSA